MDIEEIQCPLCSQIYNESDRVPILLPDCGHSFCASCINACFELLKDYDFDDDSDENEDIKGDKNNQIIKSDEKK